jgi:hypothetical protein
MTDLHRAPFEDGSPPSGPAAAVARTGAAASRGGGPAPGSADEAEIIFRALGAGASASPRQRLPVKAGAIVAVAVIVALMVVVLVLAADHLRSLQGSNSSGDGTAGAGGAALSSAETNVDSALVAARSIEAAPGHGLSDVTSQALGASVPSLEFAGLSGSATQIAVANPTTGSLVLASFQENPAACVGVLQIVSSQGAPVFSGDPATAQPGTYYFEAPAPGGVCNALTIEPPAGGTYVSTSGFPTSPLR